MTTIENTMATLQQLAEKYTDPYHVVPMASTPYIHEPAFLEGVETGQNYGLSDPLADLEFFIFGICGDAYNSDISPLWTLGVIAGLLLAHKEQTDHLCSDK